MNNNRHNYRVQNIELFCIADGWFLLILNSVFFYAMMASRVVEWGK